MTPADRLAEAARELLDVSDWRALHIRLADALAAWDADTERRQAEQDVIAAAMAFLPSEGSYGYTNDNDYHALALAVRRLRQLDQ